MELFKTDDIDKYQQERERRRLIYENMCSEPIPQNDIMIYERIKRLDQAYLDFHDKVIFEP